MTHQPASSPTTLRRSLALLATAASLALVGVIGTACMDPGEYADDSFFAAVDCAKVPTWKPGLQVKGVNDQVQLGGKVFASLIGAYTVVNDQSWAPPQATLWRQVAQCGGQVQPPPVQQPPAQQPPAQQPPAQQPPVVGGDFTARQFRCLAAIGKQTFDPAGEKNVGKSGGQFIGGRCLNNGNCASGCCANPCGICSGPGAQTQAGKQGCGFDGSRLPQ